LLSYKETPSVSNSIIQTIPKRKTREDILELSVPLFAWHGYDGVSMRDMADAVGLTPAALYYHFPDKEHLYLDVVAYAFREKAASMKEILDGLGSPWERLERFVAFAARQMATDKNFQRLMQWVILDSDVARQHKLAEHVFRDVFVAVYSLAADLDLRQDAHMFAISIFGLVFFHYQVGIARQFMPGHRPQQDNPDVLARHVIGLLRNGLGGSNERIG
jgi:AcrR family transcriptional regulator